MPGSQEVCAIQKVSERQGPLLVQVNKDIATVQSEQRKHLQQWQSSLLKVHKQEATLKVGLVNLGPFLSTWAMHVFTKSCQLAAVSICWASVMPSWPFCSA